MENIRIGQGFDIHPLIAGRKLILGGVHIPYELGLAGHSDGDALCHAITDALLGAIGLGDIGRHFPDTDAQYKDADSGKLLENINGKFVNMGWKIGNIDATIITEKPKLATHINKIEESLAKILNITHKQINIKAKTHEKFDAIGNGEALSVMAVVLVFK